MRPIYVAAFATCVAIPALAETELERMERLTEALQTKMFSTLLQGSDFDVESAVAWDDEMRRTAECVLDAYMAESSPEEMDAVFEEMEALLAQPMDDVAQMEEQMTGVASPVSQERAMEINQSCGMMSLQMKRMQDSGLMGAMMQSQMQ